MLLLCIWLIGCKPWCVVKDTNCIHFAVGRDTCYCVFDSLVASAPLVSLRTAEASAKHCLLPTEGSAPLVSLRTAETNDDV